MMKQAFLCCTIKPHVCLNSPGDGAGSLWWSKHSCAVQATAAVLLPGPHSDHSAGLGKARSGCCGLGCCETPFFFFFVTCGLNYSLCVGVGVYVHPHSFSRSFCTSTEKNHAAHAHTHTHTHTHACKGTPLTWSYSPPPPPPPHTHTHSLFLFSFLMAVLLVWSMTINKCVQMKWKLAGKMTK